MSGSPPDSALVLALSPHRCPAGVTDNKIAPPSRATCRNPYARESPRGCPFLRLARQTSLTLRRRPNTKYFALRTGLRRTPAVRRQNNLRRTMPDHPKASDPTRRRAAGPLLSTNRSSDDDSGAGVASGARHPACHPAPRRGRTHLCRYRLRHMGCLRPGVSGKAETGRQQVALRRASSPRSGHGGSADTAPTPVCPAAPGHPTRPSRDRAHRRTEAGPGLADPTTDSSSYSWRSPPSCSRRRDSSCTSSAIRRDRRQSTASAMPCGGP